MRAVPSNNLGVEYVADGKEMKQGCGKTPCAACPPDGDTETGRGIQSGIRFWRKAAEEDRPADQGGESGGPISAELAVTRSSAPIRVIRLSPTDGGLVEEDFLVPVTGVEDIDKQHILIVEMIAELQISMNQNSVERVTFSLQALLDLSTSCFANEERYMVQHHISGYELHRWTHDRFRSHVRNAISLLSNQRMMPHGLPEHLLNFMEMHMSVDEACCEKIVAAQSRT